MPQTRHELGAGDNLDSLVVMITGALSGIGRASALRFASQGARLVLCDLSLERAPEVVTEAESLGGEAYPLQVDVREPRDQLIAAEAAINRWGRVDVLVANAGIGDQSSVHNGDMRRWQAVVQTNLLGTMFSVRAVLPFMLEQGSGHIFIVASISGRETYVGEPIYIASKWGVVGFAHSLREEVKDRGIRVTIIEPGLVDTPLARSSAAVRRTLASLKPLTAENVADAMIFALSQPREVLISELTVRPLRQGTTPL